jgi:glycosyltransferase involved in cell wall biosynthesis
MSFRSYKHCRPKHGILGFVLIVFASIISECKSALFPQEEDFGITPLEAAASGVPTVAWTRRARNDCFWKTEFFL